MEHVIRGHLNKQIAADLGISEKTVKVHRGRVMAKMGVGSVAELIRLYEQESLLSQRRKERQEARRMIPFKNPLTFSRETGLLMTENEIGKVLVDAAVGPSRARPAL